MFGSIKQAIFHTPSTNFSTTYLLNMKMVYNLEFRQEKFRKQIAFSYNHEIKNVERFKRGTNNNKISLHLIIDPTVWYICKFTNNIQSQNKNLVVALFFNKVL
jgi:hypothetical protein